MPDFLLASASPRRRQLLEELGLDFIIRPAAIEEIPRAGESPEDFALRAACEKAEELARETVLPILGSDTVVAVDGEILGKPRDRSHAGEMLRRLSGRSHRVHTSLALVEGGRTYRILDTTVVDFLPISDQLIDWYISTGEPMDKAGAYAVQGAGGLFVSSIEGAPQTVIGLPIHRLPELFLLAGLDFSDFLRHPWIRNSAVESLNGETP